MNRQLWFTSSQFQPVPGEEDKTNPGRLGQALANWVKGKLGSPEEPIAEDWGWVVMISKAPFPLWVGCGNEDGSTTRWSLFVEAEPSLIQKLFKRVDPAAAVAALERQLESTVRSDAQIQDVSWESM